MKIYRVTKTVETDIEIPYEYSGSNEYIHVIGLYLDKDKALKIADETFNKLLSNFSDEPKACKIYHDNRHIVYFGEELGPSETRADYYIEITEEEVIE